MKKHIVHNFSFYIHKKINIQKTHEKKLNIKLIFSSQEKGESSLFYLERGQMRTKSGRMKLYNFLFFFKQKRKEETQE